MSFPFGKASSRKVFQMARNVLVEFSHSPQLEVQASSEELIFDATAVATVAGVTFDATYTPVALPGSMTRTAPFAADVAIYDIGQAAVVPDFTPTAGTYLLRASVETDRGLTALSKVPGVVAVYSDPEITSTISCPNGPIGSDADVENLLQVAALKNCGMDGSGVLVAIVDTGFNVDYLRSHGKAANFDPSLSWSRNPTVVVPGQAAVNHGTMVAYDVMIAAPQATLLDIALLISPPRLSPFRPPFIGLLSDAIRAYKFLLSVKTRQVRVGENQSLVVNNSWGLFDQAGSDFPVGHPANYSANPNHPFNRIVGSLAQAGADIVFAAGNCGPTCPDGRCMSVNQTIYGANGHPDVLTVGAVDTTSDALGYSSIGPGWLTVTKPDLCGYSHFKGSGVYAADGGTSAAAPVMAGVLAAVRTKTGYVPADPSTFPAAIRSLLRSAARDVGPVGFDFQYGAGIVDTAKLREGCWVVPEFDPCRKYPWLCGWDRCLENPLAWQCRFGKLCQIYPPACEGLQKTLGKIPLGDPQELFKHIGNLNVDGLIGAATMFALIAGLDDRPIAPSPVPSAGVNAKKPGCGCGGS